jgi:peptide/nickel transport system ATP-binding protein
VSEILQVENLVKHFGGGRSLFGGPRKIVRAVNDVSFTLERGGSMGLVGESGCGKSTVARTLMRLVEADSGAIVFDGIDVMHPSAAQKRALVERVQIVFQDPYASLNPRRTVRQTLEEPLRVHRRGNARAIAEKVAKTVQEVGLPIDVLDRYPHEFSGGQRQRVGIARALVLDPELVIADEPVSALDVSVQAQILQLLATLRQERGLSFVFVSHDLGVVRQFCDTVSVMYLGRIVESGPTRTLLDMPAHPYSRILKDSSPVPDPRARIRLSKIEGDIPSPTRVPSGCAFHPRCPRAAEPCKKDVPELREIAAGRRVACFFPLIEAGA